MMLQRKHLPLTTRIFAPLRSIVCARQLVWSSRTCISLTLRRALHTVALQRASAADIARRKRAEHLRVYRSLLMDMTRRLDSVEQGFLADKQRISIARVFLRTHHAARPRPADALAHGASQIPPDSCQPSAGSCQSFGVRYHLGSCLIVNSKMIFYLYIVLQFTILYLNYDTRHSLYFIYSIV